MAWAAGGRKSVSRHHTAQMMRRVPVVDSRGVRPSQFAKSRLRGKAWMCDTAQTSAVTCGAIHKFTAIMPRRNREESIPSLEPTPGGRVRVHRVPVLGGILPLAARLNANRWADIATRGFDLEFATLVVDWPDL